MVKPDSVVPELCEGFVVGKEIVKYSERDTMLYALGVGVSEDPLDEKDLKYTYERNEHFSVLPSFPVVLFKIDTLFDALMNCPGLPEFNPMMLLHGEEKVLLRKKLATDATFEQETRIKGVYDKTSGALLVIGTDFRDASSKELVCSIEHSLFIRGIGGFKGKKSPAAADNSPPKGKEPERVYTMKTRENQALLYRLNGDYNPLHVDKEMAKMGNFPRPILHGLCFFGVATHGVVREMLGNQDELVESIEGRFSNSVFPGDTLKVEMWRISEQKVIFQVRSASNNKVCLSNGCVTLRASGRAKM